MCSAVAVPAGLGGTGRGWLGKGLPGVTFPGSNLGFLHNPPPPHHQGKIRSYAPTVKGFWHLAGARRQTSARVFGSMFVWIHISWLIINLEGNRHLLLRSRQSAVSSGGMGVAKSALA